MRRSHGPGSAPRLLLAALAGCILLAGCGQRGPLTLPETEDPPAPAGPVSESPAPTDEQQDDE